jgi:predicted acylesterase/phospholipase RssA
MNNDVKETRGEYEVLVIAGGAVKGLSLLGALQYADDNFLLKNIHTYVGTSIGSFICFFLAIGYKPLEIFTRICTWRLLERLNASMNISGLLLDGIFQYSHIQEFLERAVIDKIGYYPTMKDIQVKFGKKLIITTYNISKDIPEYITPDTHPELPCITAIRMSSNIPIVFDRFKYMGCYFIDGGIADNFPVDRACLEVSDSKNVLGFYNDNEPDTNIITDDTKIANYIVNLLSITPRLVMKDIVNRNKDCKLIKVLDSTHFLDFNLSAKQKLENFSAGYVSAKNEFEL